jgi:hypothetical protein
VRIVVEAIDMANEQQLAILKHGPGVWNVYRQVHLESTVDLRQADLRQAVLEEVDFHGADLTGANLAAARVLDPIRHPSVERLVEVMDSEIIEPALARKAETLRIKEI